MPYGRWWEDDPEDTVPFYTPGLQEVGTIQSSPNKIAEDTGWRFLKPA